MVLCFAFVSCGDEGLSTSLFLFQDPQEKETVNPERAEEAKLKAKYPNLGQKPGGSDFLMKRLQKGVFISQPHLSRILSSHGGTGSQTPARPEESPKFPRPESLWNPWARLFAEPELGGAPSGHKPEAVRAAVVKQKGLVPVQNHKAGASQVVLLGVSPPAVDPTLAQNLGSGG